MAVFSASVVLYQRDGSNGRIAVPGCIAGKRSIPSDPSRIVAIAGSVVEQRCIPDGRVVSTCGIVKKRKRSSGRVFPAGVCLISAAAPMAVFWCQWS